MAAQMNYCVILTSEYKVSTNKKQYPEKPLPFYIFCLSLPLLSGRSRVRIASGTEYRGESVMVHRGFVVRKFF